MFIRTTERKTFKDCRQKWYWAHVDNLKGVGTAPALTFGNLVHAALEIRYPPGKKRGPKPALTFEKLYGSPEYAGLFTQLDSDADEKVSALELGIAMLKGYDDLYGEEDHIEIIKPEFTFDIEIQPGIRYVGTIDAIARDLERKTVFMFEHKTAKSVPAYTAINSVYGEQGLSYYWAASQFLREQNLLKPGQQIDKIIYNYLRKSMPDTRPMNSQGLRINKPTKKMVLELGIELAMEQSVSLRQPAPLFVRHEMEMSPENLVNIDTRIRQEIKEIRLVRAGKLPVYKNPDDHCRWCQFKEICELKEMGQDWEYFRDNMFITHDPYEDHRDKKE